MTVRATWNGDRFNRQLHVAVDAAATAMARTVAEQARANLRSTKAGIDQSSGRKFFTGGSKPGGFPAARSGFLSRSVTSTGAQGGVSYAGTNVKYGRYLEYGAVIRPKQARALTIPLNGEAVRLLARHRRTRNIPNLRVVKLRDGRMFLVGKRHRAGKNEKPVFLFVLKQEVRIAPRPWLLRSAKQSRSRMLQNGRAAFERSMKGMRT